MVALDATAEALLYVWCGGDHPFMHACLLGMCVQSGILPTVMCRGM